MRVIQRLILPTAFVVIILFLVSCLSNETTYPELTNTATFTKELPTQSTLLISTISAPLSSPKPAPTDREQNSLSDLQPSYMILNNDGDDVIIDPRFSNASFYIFGSVRDEIADPFPYEISMNGFNFLFADHRPPLHKPRLMTFDFRNKSIIQLLQRSESQYWASLHPDGNQVAFVLDSDVSSDIYLVDSDGNNLQKIPGIHKWNVGPQWSPDGNSIYFLSTMDDATFPEYDMYKLDLNNRSTQKITNKPIRSSDYSFSPDGSKILFSGPQMGEDIYVMNIDGSNLQNLSNSYSRDTVPSWSPDGSKILFQSDRDGDWEIYIMNRDGSDQRRMTNDSGGGFNSMWSPNGDYIAFDSERSRTRQTYVLILEDESIHQVTNSRNGSYLYYIWAPIIDSHIQFNCYIGMFDIDRILRITDEGDNLSLRNGPSLGSDLIDLLSSGDEVKIIGGPHYDGLLWWQVMTTTENITGWVVENVEWFEPINKECELPRY